MSKKLTDIINTGIKFFKNKTSQSKGESTVGQIVLKFEVGDIARSIRDGVRGTITGYGDSIAGVAQYELNIVKAADKAEYDGECTGVLVDETELVLVEKGSGEFHKPFTNDFKYNLGEKVKHQYIDYSGVITSRYEFANGCKYYNILTDRIDKDNKPVEGHFSENMLVICEKPTDISETDKSTQVKRPRTGGPRDKMPKQF